jgi:AcrR family transcriptional regulator
MPRATRAQSDATAARVLATARALFTEHGYTGVGLETLASRAGVTRGAVYHHYGSKLGLFEAVVATAQRSVADAIERAAAAAADPWDALENGCRVFLTAAAAEETRRIMLIDAPAVLGWNAWRELDAANSARLLGDVLHELAAAGLLVPTPVPAAAALLSGAMNEAALWIAAQDDPAVAIEHAWVVLRRLLRSLRPPPG